MGKSAPKRIAGNPVAPRSFQTQDVVRLPESDGNLTVTFGNHPNRWGALLDRPEALPIRRIEHKKSSGGIASIAHPPTPNPIPHESAARSRPAVLSPSSIRPSAFRLVRRLRWPPRLMGPGPQRRRYKRNLVSPRGGSPKRRAKRLPGSNRRVRPGRLCSKQKNRWKIRLKRGPA